MEYVKEALHHKQSALKSRVRETKTSERDRNKNIYVATGECWLSHGFV